MRFKSILLIAFVLCFVAAMACAQDEGELAYELEYAYETLSTNANQQKFLSILTFIVLGGGSTYAVMRGIKKIVHSD